MCGYIKVKNFDISSSYVYKDEQQKENNILHIQFIINHIHNFVFPCYEENIVDIISDFKDIIKGKSKTLSLNFNNNYNFIKFEKNYVEISLLNELIYENIRINQENKISFENNNIIRNSMRDFILRNNL